MGFFRLKRNYLLFFFVIVCINLFVYYFIKQEKYIYFWDTSGYWDTYQYISAKFKTNSLIAVLSLLNSIRHHDYNLLPVFFLTPFNYLFGNGRLPYILAISNINALPAIALFVFLMVKIFSSSHKENLFTISSISMFTITLCPQFWTPILLGYPDVIGLALINVILLLYIKEPIDKLPLLFLIILGLLLSDLVMVRRWYAYWVISFFIALALERAFLLFSEYGFKIKNYLPSIKNISVVGGVSIISFFIFATPIAEKMLFTNYADIYSAYKSSSSIFEAIKRVYYYFGPFLASFFLLGVIQSILNNKKRRFALFLLIQFIIIFLLFSRTQDFGCHHFYLLIPTIVMFIACFVISGYLWLDKKIFRLLFLGVYFIMMLINFSIVFIPDLSDVFKKTAFMYSKTRHYPLTRTDMDEINTMVGILDSVTNNDEDLIYVLASSIILNDSILKHAFLLHGHALDKKILTSAHVDKRDGFPHHFLDAKYIVIADPIQYHLRPQDQRVIGLLADQIVNQKDIGLSFQKLPYEFYLDANVKVHIYKKVSPLKKSDLDNLSKRFMMYYPDKKEIFKIKG